MIDKKYIQELADLLNENNLTEVSLKAGDKEIVLKKEKEIMAGAASVVASAQTVSAKSHESDVAAEIDKNLVPIKAPMVGTFYRAPAPGTKPFVEVGSVIKSGDVVCIIEAMKLMNEIESEISGTIVEICVEDAQLVEFGQVLMWIEVK